MSNSNNNNDTAQRNTIHLLEQVHADTPRPLKHERFPLHRLADALGMLHFHTLWGPRVPTRITRDRSAVVKKLHSMMRRLAKTRDINEKERLDDGSTWTPLGTYLRHKKSAYGNHFDPSTYATFLDAGASLRARSGGITVKEMLRRTLTDQERDWFERRGIRFTPSSYLTTWTTGAYKNVQSHRRQGTTPPVKTETERINRYVAQFMRNSALRTPAMPPGMDKQPTLLWRGVCDPTKKLASRQEIRDRGFVAFSIEKLVANRFAKQMKLSEYSFFPERHCPQGADYMLKLRVASLPPYIPWIWFTPTKHRPPNWSPSEIEEAEVLLPPGRLTIVRRTGRTLEVTYTPDTKATSFTGKRIIRQQRVPKRARSA
jgi:hypothetical protein